MMTLVFNFIRQIRKISCISIGAKPNPTHPENLVRLCKRRDEFQNIINEACESLGQNWEQQLIDRVIEYILGGESSGISVYRADTRDPFDYGHALGVIAEGISQEDFRASRGKKRKSHCTRGSLMIPTACLPKTTSYEFTPKNNLNFYPANDYHFDLTVSNPEELAISLLNGINQGIISWSFLGNEKPYEGSYRLQAAIAYSYCLLTFGKLNPNVPPSSWTDGETITASEQIDTLRYLVKTSTVDSPIPG